MSLQDVLAIALGFSFTYALLSILASTIKEGIAALSQRRSNNFRAGLESMLSSNASAGDALGTLFDRVYGHALVSGISNNSAPSYVPASNFTLALVDVLTNGAAPSITAVGDAITGLPEGRLKQALGAFVAEAGDDLNTFKSQIEKWFDDTMDRVSGVYKRWSQLFLLLIGLVLAISLNVDTIRIFSTLAHDNDVRQILADSAVQAAKVDPKTWTEEQAIKAVTDLPIPLGWTSCQKGSYSSTPPPVVRGLPQCSGVFAIGSTILASERTAWSALSVLAGWVITAIAISFGAPFWFDLLNQFVNIRAAGPKPPRADAPH